MQYFLLKQKKATSRLWKQWSCYDATIVQGVLHKIKVVVGGVRTDRPTLPFYTLLWDLILTSSRRWKKYFDRTSTRLMVKFISVVSGLQQEIVTVISDFRSGSLLHCVTRMLIQMAADSINIIKSPLNLLTQWYQGFLYCLVYRPYIKLWILQKI